MLKPAAPAMHQYQSSQTVPATSPGTTLTGTTANTKGSYTQLISSLNFDAVLVVVNFHNSFSSGVDSSVLVDIAIGSSGQETIIIPDLLAGWAGAADDSGAPRHYIFPLYIPSGSRIAARISSAIASGTVIAWLQLYGGLADTEAWWCGSQVVAYGINSGGSKGTSVTPGNSNAEGTWTSIGTTSQDHKVIVPGVQMADTAEAGNGMCLDIGIDTSSTSILRENYRGACDASERISQWGVWWPIYQPIASGSVLAARATMNGTADTMDVALYGVS